MQADQEWARSLRYPLPCRDRELVAVQVRGPFRRLLGEVVNHVQLVSGPGAIVRQSREVVGGKG